MGAELDRVPVLPSPCRLARPLTGHLGVCGVGFGGADGASAGQVRSVCGVRVLLPRVGLWIERTASLPLSRLNTGWKHLDVVTRDRSFCPHLYHGRSDVCSFIQQVLIGQLGWVPGTRTGFALKDFDVVRIEISASLGRVRGKAWCLMGKAPVLKKHFFLYRAF